MFTLLNMVDGVTLKPKVRNFSRFVTFETFTRARYINFQTAMSQAARGGMKVPLL